MSRVGIGSSTHSGSGVTASVRAVASTLSTACSRVSPTYCVTSLLSGAKPTRVRKKRASSASRMSCSVAETADAAAGARCLLWGGALEAACCSAEAGTQHVTAASAVAVTASHRPRLPRVSNFIIDHPVAGRHETAFAQAKHAVLWRLNGKRSSKVDGGSATKSFTRGEGATGVPTAGTEIASVCRARGQRLRCAAVTDAARRASYDHHGDVDQDRGELRCAT